MRRGEAQAETVAVLNVAIQAQARQLSALKQIASKGFDAYQRSGRGGVGGSGAGVGMGGVAMDGRGAGVWPSQPHCQPPITGVDANRASGRPCCPCQRLRLSRSILETNTTGTTR
jgi:hypothetical protein